MSDDNARRMEACMDLAREERIKRQVHKRLEEIGIPSNIHEWATHGDLLGVLCRAEEVIAEARRELEENSPEED